MSKLTPEMPDAESIKNLLNQVARDNEWYAHQSSDLSNPWATAYIDRDGDVVLSGSANIRRSESDPIQRMDIDIVLAQNSVLGIYLVQQFSILSNGYINETTLFKHRGMRCAKTSDRTNSNVGKLWTIGCADDLHALFDAYNKVARVYHKPQIQIS